MKIDMACKITIKLIILLTQFEITQPNAPEKSRRNHQHIAIYEPSHLLNPGEKKKKTEED
jgi:hypothetical protein